MRGILGILICNLVMTAGTNIAWSLPRFRKLDDISLFERAAHDILLMTFGVIGIKIIEYFK
jgi:hypothetical protein